MSSQIIGLAPGLAPSLNPWLESSDLASAGARTRAWAQQRFDLAVEDIFGYHALQLDAPSVQTFAKSRITHRWMSAGACLDDRAALFANASALPFFAATLDLVTLPLTLDVHSDPDAVLDEVARVLVPEGRAIFVGFHALSRWGVLHQLGGKQLPEGTQIYGLSRLKASLEELGLVVESVERGAWTKCEGLYCVIAQKRVMAVRQLRRRAWKLPRLADLPINPLPTPRPRGLRSSKTNKKRP